MPSPPDEANYKADYDRKARELRARQTEIAVQIEQHQAGDGIFRTTLESLIP